MILALAPPVPKRAPASVAAPSRPKSYSRFMTHSHPGLDGLFHTHTHGGHTHTHLNPEAARSGVEVRLHLRGVVLPEGEEHDLWTHDGVLSFEPVEDAITLATGVWIMPGLVDAHSHIGLDQHGPISDEETEEQAITERDAGVLLVRDAGSPSDTRWIDDRDDLPRVVRAGRHIARPKRYLRNYAEEIEPEQLSDEVARQAQRGDGWVKLVGDWIDRDEGDLAPLWPQHLAEQAIETAHAHGAKVTAHCFGEDSVAQLVSAGIDGIEHGTGASDDVIEQMASRGVALVPTMINLENFPGIADAAAEKFPTYAAHMRDLYARRLDVMSRAREAGVPIYAGTDAGGVLPHGLIGDEIAALGAIGDADFALGAASWRAREWLGFAGIDHGAPADLVIFDADPRVDLGAARHPKYVVLRGVVYQP